MSDNPRATLNSIQYLRGVAALAVVAHHTEWTHTQIGQAGVDLFFIISGFIMVHVSRREPSLTAFLRARAVRLAPLYWLATLLAAALAGTSDVTHLLQSLAFWPHAGPEGRGWPVLVQGWTLNYEAFFYVVFAVSLLLPAARRLLMLTAGSAALILAGVMLHPTNTAAATYTSPMLMEFLAGAWLHRAWERGWLPKGWQAASFGTLGVVLLAIWARSPVPEATRALAYGLPMLLIAAAALRLEVSQHLPTVPLLGRIGDSSYALYLTHLFVLQAIRPVTLPLPTVVALPLAIAACVAVGWVVHRWVEVPLGTMLHSRRRTMAAG